MTVRTSPPRRGPCVVAVVGGGAAGVLCAVHLLRSATRSTSCSSSGAEQVGAGLAYGTTDPAHLLNVRASGMSAFDDEPGAGGDMAGDLAAGGLITSARWRNATSARSRRPFLSHWVKFYIMEFYSAMSHQTHGSASEDASRLSIPSVAFHAAPADQ